MMLMDFIIPMAALSRLSVAYSKGSQTFQAVTPKLIIFQEVGTPLYLFDSIPQINIVKIADLKEISYFHNVRLFLA